MNSNLHSTEHSNIEHYSNFEHQLENMVSKLIDEPTMTNDLNFKDVPYKNGGVRSLPGTEKEHLVRYVLNLLGLTSDNDIGS